MLGELLNGRTAVAVAGTHGKSTTVAMAAELLSAARLAPTVIAGAAPLGRHTGGRHGTGRLGVVEACEYRAIFLHLRPHVAVLLGIEHDHFDYFASLADVETTFAQFIGRMDHDGCLLVHAGCPRALRLARQSGRRVVSFGLSALADWRAEGLHSARGKYSFWITHHHRRVAEVKLAIAGKHQVINALAAAAAAAELGVAGKTIGRALGHFPGLERRLETRGSWRDIVLLDDYAHHPTEVTATLAAVREAFPGRRLCCIFQRHQASRTWRLLDEFASCLHNADRIVVF